ncbi:MAG TPA: NTP transferase domain-containing protein [Kofleriaceae bacterium]|nr:NTP transferase domain-containing protein [Kofleriaceae bacterium]
MNLAAVILAAGAGRRLGGAAKALLMRDGASYLEVVSARARAVGATEVVVVVAQPHRDAVEREARRLGLATAVNPVPERGMVSSVAVGFAWALARAAADAALLWPVDHPDVTAATLRALLDAPPAPIVVPTWDGRGGHPTLFSREVWPELAACAGLADGARAVVHANPARVTRVQVTEPGVVRDVDAPGDLS